MDWNWRFGKTPSFTHSLETRFDWGIVDMRFNCERGAISGVEIFSDSLNPEMIETLKNSLVNAPYDAAGISRAIARAARTPGLADTEAEKQLMEVQAWLLKAI